MATYICGLETECSSSGVANKYVTKARVTALGKSIRSDSVHTYTDAQIVAKRDIITKTETLYSDVVVGAASLNASGDIAASGGSNYAKATVTYNLYTRTTYADGNYTDGAKSAKSATITGATITGSDLGTTLKNRTSLGTSTPSGTVAGQTRTATGVAVYQAANYVTKVVAKVSNPSTATTHVYYSGSIVAKGGDKSPTGNGAATYTFSSGKTIDDSTTSPSFGGTSTYTRTYTEKTDTASAFTVASNGVVTAANRTTTEGAARSVTVTSKLTIKYVHPTTYKNAGAADVTSSELSHDVTCTQALNKITGITISGTASSGTVTTIPSSGGTVTWTPTVTFSSESTLTSSSNFTVTYALSSTTNGASLSTNVTTWAGRGTTDGTARSVTVTASVTSTYTTTAVKSSAVTTTQAANTKTYSSAKLVPYLPDSSWIVTVSSGKWGTCPASGGYIKCYGYAVYSYTATTATTEELITSDASLTFSGGMPTWVEAHTNGGYHVKTRGTTPGDPRSFTVSWTYNNKTSNSLTLTQGKNEITDSNYNPSGYTASVSIGNLGTVATNLLGNGGLKTTTNTSGTNTTVGTIPTTTFTPDWLRANAGKTLCFSFIINRPNAGTNGTSSWGYNRYGRHFSLTIGGSATYPMAELLTVTGTNKLVYCTYTIPATTTNYGSNLSLSGLQGGTSEYARPSSGTWEIGDYKLEFGSTPTRELNAAGGAGIVTCDGQHNAYNKYTSGSVDSATHVVKDGATIAITTNGNSRFALSSNLTGAWLTHMAMGTSTGTDTVVVTATNKNNSSATNTATKSITNSITYSDVQPLTSYYPWVGASGNSSVSPTITYEQTATYTSGVVNTITSGATISYARATYIYGDPMFYSGKNSISVYNNTGNGNVTHTYGTISGVPNATGLGITIRNVGAAYPNLGGWYFGYTGTAGLTYICSFTANVPSGRSIEFHTNSIGSGGTSLWLTPHAGLGKWATYSFLVTFGTSPSSSFYFSITGTAGTASSPVTWYLGTSYLIKSSGVSATTPALTTSTGVFNIPSRGSTICNAGSISNGAVKATITLNGKSSVVALYPELAGNYVTKVDVTTALSYSTIGAGATSASPTRSASVSKYTFTSGSTSTSAPGSTYGTLTGPSYSYKLSASLNGFTAVNATSGALTATSRGTTYGASARASGTVTQTASYTWTHASAYGSGAVNGSATTTATCSLNANTITLTSTVSGGGLTNPSTYSAAGATKSVANSAAATISVSGTFSSGSNAVNGTHFTVSGPSYSWSSNLTYATLTNANAASLNVTMAGRGTENNANTRSATITRTASFTVAFTSGNGGSGNGTKTGSTTATVTLSGNVINYALASLSCTYSNIDWKGGSTSAPSVSYSISRTWSSGSSAGTNITTGGSLSFSGAVLNSSGATYVASSGVVTRNALNTSTADLIVMKITPSVTYGGVTMTGGAVNILLGKIQPGLDVRVTNNTGAGLAIVYMISSSSTKPAYNASGWTYNSANMAINAATTVLAVVGTGVLTPYYVNIKYITSSNWTSAGALATGVIAQFKISDFLHYGATLSTSAFSATTAKVPSKGYWNGSSIVTY